VSENAEERYTPDGAAPGLLALSVITALWALQVSDRKWLASPLLAKTAHAAHRERLGPAGCSSANRGPGDCQHRISPDSADPSAAAVGVIRRRTPRRPMPTMPSSRASR